MVRSTQDTASTAVVTLEWQPGGPDPRLPSPRTVRTFVGQLGLLVALVSLVTIGCASSAAPTPTPVPSGFIDLPVELSPSFPPAPGGALSACGLVGFDDSVLHGSPSAADAVWVEAVAHPGVKIAVRWPAGFRARFSPELELLDPAGAVVAREGDVLTNLGGYPGSDRRFDIAEFDGKTYPPCS